MTPRLRIAHLVSTDSGGASKAAYRLHLSLIAAGVDSQFFACERTNGWPTVQYLTQRRSFFRLAFVFLKRLAKLLLTLGGKNRREIDIQIVPQGYLAQIDRMNFDLIHFHWVDGSVASLSELSKVRAPILWTLHDMRAFTGGYYYLGSHLEKWMESEETLPAHDMNDHPFVRWAFRSKMAMYKKKKVAAIAPSAWMEKCVRNADIFPSQWIRRIPYEIPQDPWQNVSSNEARKKLGLPATARIILFGADTLAYSRKGGDLLVAALKKLDASLASNLGELIVVSFGGGEIAELEHMPYRYKSMGRISDEKHLAELYAAANVFVAPSREDNLPNVVLESLAAGTPVVAFHIGGMPDMIEDGVNGRLVTPFSTDRLLASILEVLQWDDRDAVAKRCRDFVSQKFHPDQQCKNVIRFYQDFLSDSK